MPEEVPDAVDPVEELDAVPRRGASLGRELADQPGRRGSRLAQPLLTGAQFGLLAGEQDVQAQPGADGVQAVRGIGRRADETQRTQPAQGHAHGPVGQPQALRQPLPALPGERQEPPVDGFARGVHPEDVERAARAVPELIGAAAEVIRAVPAVIRAVRAVPRVIRAVHGFHGILPPGGCR